MISTKVRRARTLGVAFLLVLTALLLPVSCDTGSDDGATLPVGTWRLDTPAFSQSERWTITASEIHYESSFDNGENFSTTYRATIERYSTSEFNGGDTAITTTADDAIDPGYAVIRYTEVDGAATGEVDKYNIFRWATNADDASARDYTQGFKDADSASPFINIVFDTADTAETGATNANGYFAGASAGATLVE